MQLEMWVADPEVDDVELSDDDESDCADTWDLLEFSREERNLEDFLRQ